MTVVHGNRDFMLGRRFAQATGCRVVAGGLRVEMAGQETLLLHGDELCLRDRAYQRAKRILRSGAVRGLLRLLPQGFALRMARRARTASRNAQSGQPSGRYEATAAAIARVFEQSGCKRLIHGHVHRPARTPFGPGSEVIVLPAFDDSGVHLVAEDGQGRYSDASGEELPDFPPQRWT